MKSNLLFLLSLLVCVTPAFSQLVIGNGVTIASTKDTPINCIISGDVSIQSTTADLSNCTLQLTGQNQNLSSQKVALQSLIINGQQNATIALTGEWDILQELQLNRGIISPDANNGKLLFSGMDQPNGSDSSYVNGVFYSQKNSFLNFPIGNADGYFPTVLNNVTSSSTIGLQVTKGDVQFTTSGEVTEVMNSRYYILSADRFDATSGTTISLSLNGADNLSNHTGLIVLQGDQIGGAPTSISGQEGLTDFVTSTQAPKSAYLAIGKNEVPIIIIYDMITPFTQDGKNDKLKISNIGLTVENKVTLLDRWGTLVKEWTNFKNYDDEINPNNDNFDFTKLSPGNYICVTEYKFKPDDKMKKMAQMITVLKIE